MKMSNELADPPILEPKNRAIAQAVNRLLTIYRLATNGEPMAGGAQNLIFKLGAAMSRRKIPEKLFEFNGETGIQLDHLPVSRLFDVVLNHNLDQSDVSCRNGLIMFD